MTARKMTCPECKVDMNHHADKVTFSDAQAAWDADFEGILEEVHTCPKCGEAASRRADGTPRRGR